MMMKRMARVVVCVLAFAAAGAGTAAEMEGGIDLTFAGRYIWRGIPLNEEAVLEPSIGISGGGFSLNVWGNMDLTDWGEDAGYGDETGDFTEIDLTADYSREFGPVTLAAGFVTYTFPNLTELGAVSTTEVYGGISLDVPLSPSLTSYVDIDGQATEGANYTSLDLGHSFELYKSGDFAVGLDLSGRLGYANDKFIKAYFGITEESRFSDWSASVALPVTMPHGFYVTPAYVYSSLMSGPLREEVADNWGLDQEAGVFMVSVGVGGEL